MFSGKLRKKLGKRFLIGVPMFFVALAIIAALIGSGCAGGARTYLITDKGGYVKGRTIGSETPEKVLEIEGKQLSFDGKVYNQQPINAVNCNLAQAAKNNDTTVFDAWLERREKLLGQKKIEPQTPIICITPESPKNMERDSRIRKEQSPIYHERAYYLDNSEKNGEEMPYSCAIQNFHYDKIEIRDNTNGQIVSTLAKGNNFFQLHKGDYTMLFHKDKKMVKKEKILFPCSRETGLFDWKNYDIVIIR